ncbi:hypothetical protein [Bacillus subtilis]|uniref:hypothetical protein n=1 Tax=Bacillus subtilis TaxID=1423 RepID=UPI0009B54F2B|nr:hypothetical protein [Bacillus subtilis]
MTKELEKEEKESSAEETPKKEEQEDAPKWAKNLMRDIQNLVGTKEQPEGQAQEIPVPEPPKVEEPEEEEPPAPSKGKKLLSWLW